jgi:hypothetical protein
MSELALKKVSKRPRVGRAESNSLMALEISRNYTLPAIRAIH